MPLSSALYCCLYVWWSRGEDTSNYNRIYPASMIFICCLRSILMLLIVLANCAFQFSIICFKLCRVCVPIQSLSHVWFFAALWTVAQQAPLSMGFPRQKYWNRLPFPPPGNLPDPRIEPYISCLLYWQVDSSPLAPPGKPMQSKVL